MQARPSPLRAQSAALLSVALASATLAGCVVGPNYQGPPTVAPQAVAAPAFHRAEDAASTPPPARWWIALGDAQLDQLIDDAFAASPDLEVAAARLRRSRADLSKARANLAPTTGAAGVYLNSQGLTAPLTGGSGGAIDLYDAALDATWQIDLFGGQRRVIEGDKAAAQAAIANLQDAQVSLAAEVAQDYVTLRDLQHQVDLAQQTVALESRMLAMAQLRRQGGAATDLDVERLTLQLRASQADAVPLRAQIADQLDRLAILTGRAPGDLDQQLSAPGPVPLPPAQVAVGDPATLLRNRPDVRAAERAIQQKNALIGQRTADLFPKVQLLGEVGYSATNLSNLFDSNNFSHVVAPILQWSPFDFGRIHASINEAEGERAEALANYRKTVLGALADAETALATYGRQRDSLRSLLAVQASADHAATLTALRVQGGAATSLDQLTAEGDRVTAQTNVDKATAQLTLDFIRLEKSLGLGWTAPEGPVGWKAAGG